MTLRHSKTSPLHCLLHQDSHQRSCLVCPVFLSVFHLLFFPSRPSLQTRVTLLHQMAFCLAELHLWSTKSSLQVKGTTYHPVQSPSLLYIHSPFSFSSHSFCHHSLCFHTFSPLYQDILQQSNSYSTSIHTMSVYCIISDVFVTLLQM